jgi:hypothetical protein
MPMDEKKGKETPSDHTDINTVNEKCPPSLPDSNNTVEGDGVKIHPQPTTDFRDPLNWSSGQKHTILGIVMLKYNIVTSVPGPMSADAKPDISYSPISPPQPSPPSPRSNPNLISATLR